MKLISQYGNEIISTEDKRKIDYLKNIGFTEFKKTTNKKAVDKNGSKKETE